LLKRRKERCFNAYSLEEEGCGSKLIFGSMNNISVISIDVPDAPLAIQHKVIKSNIVNNYSESGYVISQVIKNKAIVYVYDKKWLKTLPLNSNILPEIYLVPFHEGFVSVCATEAGFIIRETESSGFRLDNSSAVKEYLLERKYKLFNLSSKSVNQRWKQLNRSDTMDEAWLSTGSTTKIRTSIRVNARQITMVLSVLIVASWANIATQINTHQSELNAKNEYLSTQVGLLAKSVNLKPSASKSDVFKQIESAKLNNKADMFKNLLSYHYSDDFEIDDFVVSIGSKDKSMPNINGATIVYDK
jgi:hypothetical protein